MSQENELFLYNFITGKYQTKINNCIIVINDNSQVYYIHVGNENLILVLELEYLLFR